MRKRIYRSEEGGEAEGLYVHMKRQEVAQLRVSYRIQMIGRREALVPKGEQRAEVKAVLSALQPVYI